MPPSLLPENLSAPKISAQNIYLRRNKLLAILKCIPRMFAQCCEQKIVVMSESMSELHFRLMWTRQSDHWFEKEVFYLRCMNNQSLKNFSSLLKKWSPRKTVRSEIITETITTYQFLHWKYEFFRGGISKQDPRLHSTGWEEYRLMTKRHHLFMRSVRLNR